MPFNQRAFRKLVERTGLSYSELHRAIRDETDHVIERHTLEEWGSERKARPPTTSQMDALYRYAASTGNSNLRFYTRPRT